MGKTLRLYLLPVLIPLLAAHTACAENLPPDPGKAGKATLAGIDSDNDSVRDDVQRWIALTYPNSQKTRAVLMQRAKTMQQFLLDAADPVKSLANARRKVRDTDCLEYVQPNNYYEIGMEMRVVFLNTDMRSKAWLQADRHLSGHGFTGLRNAYLKQGCKFNPDAMPN